VPTAHVNGIDLEYVIEGDPSDPSVLLVMGLGGQLTAWPDGFVSGLRDRGYFIVRFDNRDCGLSTKWEGVPDILALFTGDTSSAPYRVEDMADDAAALLAHLGITTTHVVGVSMGGMITQALVINHPERVLTACSIMSTTGDRAVGARHRAHDLRRLQGGVARGGGDGRRTRRLQWRRIHRPRRTCLGLADSRIGRRGRSPHRR